MLERWAMDEVTLNGRTPENNRPFYIFNAILSSSALAFLAYLLLVRRSEGAAVDLRFLPAVNASLNALAASLLVAGWVAIRNKARRLHQYFMVGAFAASALFLICYVTYHFVHGDTKYQGTGPLRTVYFVILISHVLLSLGIVPMALSTLYFAWKRRFSSHRRIARIALPIWLYVSVTGVVIFFMLRSSLPSVS
jgi:putative membrane protein